MLATIQLRSVVFSVKNYYLAYHQEKIATREEPAQYELMML